MPPRRSLHWPRRCLSKNGALVEEGSGRNSLRSPALCLAELVSAVAKAGGTPLTAGDLVSTGTLTESKSIAPGETWTATIGGLDLPALTLRLQRADKSIIRTQ